MMDVGELLEEINPRSNEEDWEPTENLKTALEDLINQLTFEIGENES